MQLNPILCSACQKGFVINGSASQIIGSVCYINTNLSNCLVASSSADCTVCIGQTYGLVNGSCVKGAISNCISYNYNKAGLFPTCEACSTGYYLSTVDNEYVSGIDSNCVVYNNKNATNCTQCSNGYVLQNKYLGNTLCAPFDSVLNVLITQLRKLIIC